MTQNLVNKQTMDIPMSSRQELEIHLGDAPTLDSYTKTSIASFGVEMLKQMGWYEGRGIGKTPQIFKPIDIKPRHYRQGLGADTKFSNNTKKITKDKKYHEKKDDGKKKKLKWVQSGMRLQIISKHYHDGDYLRRVGNVVERVDAYAFAFKLDPPFASVLYDLKERQVEPIESCISDRVCVIGERKRGEFGRILEKKNNIIMLELEESGEVVNMETKSVATLIE